MHFGSSTIHFMMIESVSEDYLNVVYLLEYGQRRGTEFIPQHVAILIILDVDVSQCRESPNRKRLMQ